MRASPPLPSLSRTQADPVFNLAGFIMAVGSTALRGVKSVMQELIMSRDANKLDAVNLLRCVLVLTLISC